MSAFSSRILFFVLTAVLLFYANGAADDDAIIPGQYIVFYAKNTDRIATNERLFFSSSISSLDDSFQVVHALEDGIAVAGITDEQYQELLLDESVEKVIPVSHSQNNEDSGVGWMRCAYLIETVLCSL